jgi:hypothetical protein
MPLIKIDHNKKMILRNDYPDIDEHIYESHVLVDVPLTERI